MTELLHGSSGPVPRDLPPDPTNSYNPDKTDSFSLDLLENIPTSGSGVRLRAPDKPIKEDATLEAEMFHLLELIGKGGHGEVWEAEQLTLRRSIAVKRISDELYQRSEDNPKLFALLKRAFLQEALIAASLEHSNIIPIYDLGCDAEGRPLLAMKKVRGTAWNQMLSKDFQQLSIADFLGKHVPILIDVAQAIAFAHSRGVIHRDIKPSQVIVSEFGETVLMDWGLAILYRPKNPDPEHTPLNISSDMRLFDPASVSAPAGTPAYMAPEQTHSTPDLIGPWTDVYLLGATLYFILTGWPPHNALTSQKAFLLAREIPPEPPEQRAPDREVPKTLSALCQRAMASHIEDRMQSVREFITELQDYLTGASKRHESQLVTDHLREVLDRGITTYDELSICTNLLDRGLALWAENPALTVLRERVLHDYARIAIHNKDLVLARVQANRLKDNKARKELLAEIDEIENHSRRLHRQRHIALVTAITLVLTLIVGSSSWFWVQSYRRAKKAEFSEFMNDLDSARSQIFAGDFQSARELLQHIPAYLRQSEWGRTMKLAHQELLTLPGNQGSLTDGCISPDGHLLATATERGVITLWDLERGVHLGEMSGHSSSINDLNFSRDGQYIASASNDETAIIWDVKKQSVLQELTGHTEPVFTAQFSPDDKMLLTSSADHKALIWDVKSGRLLTTLIGHDGPVLDACFDQQGKRIATASADGTAIIWEVPSGQILRVLQGHDGAVNTVRFSPITNQILTASNDCTARLWDLDTGMPLHPFIRHNSEVYKAELSPDGVMILTASKDSTAKLYSLDSENELSLITHASHVNDARFSSHGLLIVTASSDKTAAVFRTATGESLATLRGHAGEVVRAFFTPDNTRVVTLSKDSTAKIWDTFTQNENMVLAGHQESVNDVDFSPDGRWILTASEDRTAWIWDSSNGRHVITLGGHEDVVNSARFSPDGKTILTASYDGTARLWDTATGTQLKVVGESQSGLVMADFSPNGQMIVTTGFDQRALVWNLELGEPIVTLNGHNDVVVEAAFHPDNKRILTASLDQTAKIWNLASGKELVTLKDHTGPVISCAFSPDGTMAATGGMDDKIKVWNTEDGQLISTFSWPRSDVRRVTFSPSGTRILASDMWNIYNIDLGTGRVLETLYGSLLVDRGPQKGMAVSPDQRLLAISHKGGDVTIWGSVPWDIESLPDGDSANWAERFETWQRDSYHRWMNSIAQKGFPDYYWRLNYLAEAPFATGYAPMKSILDETKTSLKRTGRLSPEINVALSTFQQQLDELKENHASMSPYAQPLIKAVENSYKDKEIYIAQRISEHTLQNPRSLLPDTSSRISMYRDTFQGFLSEPLLPAHMAELLVTGEEREVRVLCSINSGGNDKMVFINGSLPEIGEWTPNKVPMRYLGENRSGHVWEIRLPLKPMEFKFTYGKQGDDWIGTEEWIGTPNRSIPQANAPLYVESNGGLVYLSIFGRLADE